MLMVVQLERDTHKRMEGSLMSLMILEYGISYSATSTMDEEPTSNVEEHMEGESGMSSKGVRHRKKQLYKDIRKQMEFYFSDANLTKDRFLGELVMQDSRIDVSVFTRFNKLRAMTTDIKYIVNALRNSELLDVTEDGTKVFRKIPFKPKENTDDCTIYVEQLPPDAQHDWLKGVFSAYGKVAYVSIPKFKSTGKIKGFAFVEFETPEEANKTLEAFGAMGCHLSAQMAPEKLCSIATFESEDKKYEEVPDKVKRETNENEANQSLESPSKKKKKKKKIKLEPSEETITEDSKNTDSVEESEIAPSAKIRKRKKTQEDADESETESGPGQTEDIEDTPPKRKKKRKSGSTEELQETNAEESISSVHSTVTEPQLEKKTKKKRSEDSEEKSNNSNDEVVEAIESISKKKRKRGPDSTEETDECKVTSSDDIKRHSEKKKKNEDEEEEEEEQPTDVDNGEVENIEKETDLEMVTEAHEEEMVEGSSKKKRKRKKKHKKDKQDAEASRLQVLSKKEWKRLRNKYLDLQKTKMKALKQYLNNKWNRNAGGFRHQYANGCSQEKEEHGEESTDGAGVKQETLSKPKISFTPGVIVHATFDEPILDLRKFKADTKAMSEVQYIDVVMGANEAFIRCATSAAAENLVTNSPWQQKEVLKGEVEKNYWEKIFKDRELKFSKNIRVKQRGRDKILRRAERELGKHIKFDD